MIRGLTTIKRSTVAAPAKLFHDNGLSEFTKLRPLPLARNFNTYPQPFPYYGGQVNSCQGDPYQRYYANRNAYQLNPNFAHFHPGVYGPHPRFGYQFRGDFSPYPVGGAWRSFGPEYRCRCCGCQQFLPVAVNYGGNWNWNPNAGMYRGGVVQGNGYVDQGINYNCGDWSQMRHDTFRNNTDGGRGNFNGNDVRNLGPYGANSSDFPRNQNEGRDYNANQNQNVGQHRQNLGDSYNERQEVPRVNGFEEQNIAHGGYRRPQDAYRWNNHNFTENDERDGRDQVAWTQSRSSYNPYGPEHSFHSESKRFNQGTGYVDRKNVNTDNQTRLENNGGAIGGQFQNSTVIERPTNSNGAGGGEEYKQTGQISRDPDVLRKNNNHGSNEHNWSFNSQCGSDYSRDEVMGSNGHENLNRPGHENSKPFQQNLNSSDFPRNQNENEGRDYNVNQNQNVGQRRQYLGDSYYERQEVPRVNGFEEQKIAHDGYRRPHDAYRWNNHNFTENDGRDGRDQVAWTQSRSSCNHYGPEHSFHGESERFNQGTGYVDRKNVTTDNQTRPANNGVAIGGQFQNSTVNGCPLNSNRTGGGEEYKQTEQSSRVPDVLRKGNNHNNWGAIGGQFQNSTVNERPLNSNEAGGGEEYKQTGQSSRVPDVLRKGNKHNNWGAIGGQFQNSTVNERPLNSNEAGGGEEYKQTGQSSRVPDVLRKDNNHGSNEHNWSFTSQFRSDYSRDEVMSSCRPENLNRPGHENSKAFQQILDTSHGKILNDNAIGGQYEKRFNVASNGEASRIFQDNKGAKQDGVIAWDDDECWNESDMGNLYDPLPDFIANEPLNPSKTNAQKPNIKNITIVHDSNDATRMSIDASRRCRRIIDLLESEDE